MNASQARELGVRLRELGAAQAAEKDATRRSREVELETGRETVEKELEKARAEIYALKVRPCVVLCCIDHPEGCFGCSMEAAVAHAVTQRGGVGVGRYIVRRSPSKTRGTRACVLVRNLDTNVSSPSFVSATTLTTPWSEADAGKEADVPGPVHARAYIHG